MMQRNPTCPHPPDSLPGAIALAVALVVLPLAMALPVQTDHALQLLILPAWWLLGRTSRPGTAFGGTDRWLLFSFAVATVLSIACSAHPARSTVAAAALWWTLAAVATARGLAGRRTAGILVLAGIAIGASIGVIAVRIGLAAGTNHIPLYTHARIFGLHMFIGAIAAIGWVMLSFSSATRNTRIAAWLVAWITWTGLAWSGSRAPALGLAFALVVWFFSVTGPERKRLLIHTLLLGAAGLTTSYLLGPNFGDGWWHALARTSTAGTDLSALSSTRSDFWEVVWREILRSPWFGHGGDHYLFMRPRQVGNQPHNFVLQWLLEYGFAGAIPLFVLLARRLHEGFRSSVLKRRETTVPHVAWPGLIGSTVCALFDGVFYHVIVALPVAVLAGLCFAPLSEKAVAISIAPRRWLTGWLTASALVILVHNALSLALTKTIPSSPQTPAAHALRLFPSETFGLWHWLNAWKANDPDTSLEWAQWAQSQAIHPAWFHLYAAQCLWEQNDIPAALREVDMGLREAASMTEKAELGRLRRALEQRSNASHAPAN